jgi:hypothetical protein
MSSIYDKASLVLIPSGTKTSKVYSQKPVSGNGDFTFSRSTAATRVNADGNIEKETQNLLTYSNTFSSWVPQSGITLTANQAGYDGSSDAWKLEKNASSYRNIRISVSVSGVYTTSVYAKAGTLNLLTIRDGSNQYARFYLSTGTYTLSNSPVSGAMVDVGNGWYRCSVTMTTSNPTIQIYPDWNQTTAGYIYIQDAQLNQGLIAQEVITTTTAAVEGGITDNVPRLDYTDSSCPALLLEPQRTNLFTQSEYLNGFTTSGSPAPTLTANYAESPEGLYNAYRVEIPSVSGLALMAQLVSHTSGTDMTISAYVKSNVASNQSFKLFGDYGTGSGTSGTLTATSEWQRFTFTFTPTATGSRNAGILNVANTAADLVVYAMQVEAGSYATSYIPTYGTSVSRVKDFTQMSLSSFDLTGSFSMHYHFGKTQKTATASSSFAHYNTDTNDFFLYTNSSGSDGLNIYLDGPNGGYIFGSGQNDAWSTDESKICITYDATTGRLAYFINGVKFNEQTNFLSFGDATSNPNFQGDENIVNINRYLFFTQALTDQEAIDLTTI